MLNLHTDYLPLNFSIPSIPQYIVYKIDLNNPSF